MIWSCAWPSGSVTFLQRQERISGWHVHPQSHAETYCLPDAFQVLQGPANGSFDRQLAYLWQHASAQRGQRQSTLQHARS